MASEKLKPGDIVRVEGHRTRSKVAWTVTPFAVLLEKPINGLRWWNVKELIVVKRARFDVRKPKPRKPRGPNGPRPEDRYSALGLLNIVNLLGCWDRAKPKGER